MRLIFPEAMIADEITLIRLCFMDCMATKESAIELFDGM